MYFFFEKSIWVYLLATIVIAHLAPLGPLDSFVSFIIYFISLMVLVVSLMVLSAKMMARRLSFDADVTFGEKEITVAHRNKALTEVKDWGWVKKIDSKKDQFYLVLKGRTPFTVSIPKSKLTDEEIAFFERKRLK
jgi:hypothetical protein